VAVTLDRFRELFAGIPMPVAVAVAVVAVAGADGVAGATVSSFCSLSAEPPPVLVALDRTSDSGAGAPRGAAILGECDRDRPRRRLRFHGCDATRPPSQTLPSYRVKLA